MLALLADFQQACAELQVRYYVFGAQAALLFGSPRLTADVDITVLLGDVTSEELAQTLVQHGFSLRFTDPAFARTTRVLPVLHVSSAFPADVVLGGPGLEELFLQRSVVRSIHGLEVPVASPEDLIVMKVLAGRRKDEEDVVAVLSAQQGKLDLTQIRQTLHDLTVALAQDDLLPTFERLLNESA